MAGSGTAHLRPTRRGAAARRAPRRRVPGRPHRAEGPRGLRRQPRRDAGRDARPRRRVGLRQVDDRQGDHAAAAPELGRRSHFEGDDLTTLSGEELRKIRTRMKMIFQDPISSLNPRRKVEDIIAEGLQIWKIGTKEEQQKKVDEVMLDVGLDPDAAARPAAAPVLRRPVPAHLDRPRGRHRPEADHLRRAGLRARRVGAGADPEPARGHEAPLRPHADLHRPRPRGREERERPRRRDVPRQDLRGRHARRALRAARASVHRRRCSPRSRSRTRTMRPEDRPAPRRRDPVAGRAAERLPVPHPLPEGAGPVRVRGAADPGDRAGPVRRVPLPADAGRDAADAATARRPRAA